MASERTRSEPNERYKCRITVLRCDFNEDLYRQYPSGSAEGCGRHQVGQVFETDNPWDPPQGLCLWAWGDLRSSIHRIHAGNAQTMIACCTDGLRPVTFKLEAVEI